MININLEEILIPSFHIFPLDLTYSLSDTIAEYDALAIININGREKQLALIECVSGMEEEKKIIRDLKLWSPPVIYFSKKRFRWPLYLKAEIDIKKKLRESAEIFRRIWLEQYELFNLLNFSIVLLHSEIAKKIQNDFKKFSKIKNPKLRCLSSIVCQLQNLRRIHNIKLNDERENIETLKNIFKLDLNKINIIYVFPQLIFSVDGVRKYFPVNLVTTILENISKERIQNIYVRIIGVNKGKLFSLQVYQNILYRLEDNPRLCFKINIIPIVSDDIQKILNNIRQDLKCIFLRKEKKVCITFLIANDYNKDYFMKIVSSVYRELQDKNVSYKFLLIPETVFEVKENIHNSLKRLVELKSPFNREPKKTKISRKNIMLIEGLDAKRLANFLAQIDNLGKTLT